MESAVEEVQQEQTLDQIDMVDRPEAGDVSAEEKPVEVVQGPIFAKVDGKWKKFEDLQEVPANREDGPYHPKALEGMVKNHLGEIYGSIAGVPSKNFKSNEVAIESIIYQVNKLPDFGETKSVVGALAGAPKAAKSAKVPGEKTSAKKPSGNFELLSPANSAEILKGLAPQAREIVLMATEFAAEKGSTKFGAVEFSEYITVPERAARLHTRQEPVRILTYYRSKLDELGLLKVVA